MNESSFDRRRFLGQASALAALLAAPRAAFARQLETVRQTPVTAAEEWRAMRRLYLLDESVAYFNHGSIGTIPSPVLEACKGYQTVCESNPWLHMWGGAWEEPRERVRQKLAGLLKVEGEELALIHNTTEGFNILAAGLPLTAGDEVLFSSLNHPGASICWRHHGRTRGYSVRQFDFPLRRAPEMGVEEVVAIHEREIGPSTRVLVLPHIDNMVGLRHPLAELSSMARAKGVEYIAVDGAQSVGMIDVDLSGGMVDFYAASPHKWLQAPKGLGLLYLRRDRVQEVRPMWVTWGQDRWRGTARVFEDYGTRNLPELLALGDAVDFQESIRAKGGARRLDGLRRHVRGRVEESSRLEWLSPRQDPMGGSLYSIAVKGAESVEVFRQLNNSGYVFRAFNGSSFDACRLSLNVFNDSDQIDRFVDLAEKV